MQEYRKTHPGTLLVDLGDTFDPPDSLEWEKKANLIVASMNRMGYDAMNLGDDDLALGERLLDLLRMDARFPVFGNLLSPPSAQSRFLQRYAMGDLAGHKVGILGVRITPRKDHSPDSVSLAGAIASASRLVPELRRKCDLVIVLAHMERSKAEELARQVPGIDVVLYAHESLRQEKPDRVGGTIIVGGGWRGQWIGVLRLFLGPDKKIKAFEGHFVPLTRSYIPDTHILHEVQKYRHGKWTSPEPGRGA